MANALLAGVANVDLFEQGTDALICSSKTLTDSGLNMGITGEEARGGQGNFLLGKYFHDTSFGLTLTDQVYSMQYIALNCGGGISAGSDVLTLEQQTVGENGKIKVSQKPVEFTSTSGVIGWWKKSSQDDSAYAKFNFDEGENTATLDGVVKNDIVCIKYVVTDSSAKKFVVNADYIPSTVHAIMTIGLYKAGTTKETLTTSSKIGNLVIDIPNFQLEGTQDLGLTSSGIASMSINGSALATFGGNSGCSDHGYYAIITEQLFGATEFENVSNIVIANSDIELASEETETIKVYKMFNDGTQPSLVDNAKLTFTSKSGSVATVGSHDGIVSAVGTGTTTIEVVVTDKQNLSAVAQVEVTE